MRAPLDAPVTCCKRTWKACFCASNRQVADANRCKRPNIHCWYKVVRVYGGGPCALDIFGAPPAANSFEPLVACLHVSSHQQERHLPHMGYSAERQVSSGKTNRNRVSCGVRTRYSRRDMKGYKIIWQNCFALSIVSGICLRDLLSYLQRFGAHTFSHLLFQKSSTPLSQQAPSQPG